MTKINQTILDSIIMSDNPIDFNSITKALVVHNLDPNKTTVYRNLEKLETDGLIKRVLLSDHKQYWEKAESDNHFHLICNLCNKIECREVETLGLSFGNFKVQKTDLNVRGLCQLCQ